MVVLAFVVWEEEGQVLVVEGLALAVVLVSFFLVCWFELVYSENLPVAWAICEERAEMMSYFVNYDVKVF